MYKSCSPIGQSGSQDINFYGCPGLRSYYAELRAPFSIDNSLMVGQMQGFKGYSAANKTSNTIEPEVILR